MTIKIVVRNKNKGNSSETLTLEDLLITIGSGNTAGVKLFGDEIASEQAVIINDNGQSLFINQNKGTILNGIEIDKGFPHKLSSGDSIQIGAYNLVIELGDQLSEPENAPLASESFINSNEDFADANSSFANESLITANSDANLETQAEDIAETILPKQPLKLGAETFADILSSLRKEEDQFYFQLIEADGSKRRLVIESDEIILGWDSSNSIFSTNQASTLNLPQAVIRKNWNGITIYPKGEEAILLNGTLLEAVSRLRNGDKVIFSRLIENVVHSVVLIFCEPAALIELNAMLPQELVSNAFKANGSDEVRAEPGLAEQPEAENNQQIANAAEKPFKKTRNPFYFGYFTLTEIFIMIIATIFTAALTYILLDFS